MNVRIKISELRFWIATAYYRRSWSEILNLLRHIESAKAISWNTEDICVYKQTLCYKKGSAWGILYCLFEKILIHRRREENLKKRENMSDVVDWLYNQLIDAYVNKDWKAVKTLKVKLKADQVISCDSGEKDNLIEELRILKDLKHQCDEI